MYNQFHKKISNNKWKKNLTFHTFELIALYAEWWICSWIYWTIRQMTLETKIAWRNYFFFFSMPQNHSIFAIQDSWSNVLLYPRLLYGNRVLCWDPRSRFGITSVSESGSGQTGTQFWIWKHAEKDEINWLRLGWWN